VARGVDSSHPEDHAAAIVNANEHPFAEALGATAGLIPADLTKFRASIDPGLIEECLLATGTATIRRRRLPAEQVIWLVLGMALTRNLPIAEVIRRLDLVLPDGDGNRTVASSAISQGCGSFATADNPVIPEGWIMPARLRMHRDGNWRSSTPLRPAKGPSSPQRSSSRNGVGGPPWRRQQRARGAVIRDVTDRDCSRFAPSQKSRTQINCMNCLRRLSRRREGWQVNHA
jgi:hypothetical protein